MGALNASLELPKENLNNPTVFALEMCLPRSKCRLIIGLIILLLGLLHKGLLEDSIRILVERIKKVGGELVGIVLVVSNKLRRVLAKGRLELPRIDGELLYELEKYVLPPPLYRPPDELPFEDALLPPLMPHISLRSLANSVVRLPPVPNGLSRFKSA